VTADVATRRRAIDRFTLIFVTLLLVTVAIASVTLVRYRASDPFFYNTAADAVAAQGGHIHTDDLEGYVGLVSVILTVTGMDPLDAVGLPVGMVLLPFAFAALLLALFGANWMTAVGSFLAALDLAHALTNGTMFAYAWTRYLFVIFVFAVVKGVLDEGNIGRWATVLVLSYVGMTTLHYTAPYWALLLLAGFLVLDRATSWTRQRGALLVLFIVIYAATYVEQQVTQRIVRTIAGRHVTIFDKAGDLANRAISLLTGKAPAVQDPYTFQPPTVVLATTLVFFAVAFIAWAILLARLRREPGRREDLLVLLPVLIGAISIVHGFSYGLVVGFRVDEVFVLMLPLFLLAPWWPKAGRRVVGVVVAFMLALTLVQAGAYADTLVRDSDVAELREIEVWQEAHLADPVATADGALQYQLQLAGQVRGNVVPFYKMTRADYDHLVKGETPSTPAKFVLVNLRTDQTLVFDSPRLQGFREHEGALESSAALQRAYDAGQFRGYAFGAP
jgi:hypothetical protein